MYQNFDYILRKEGFGSLLYNSQKRSVRGLKKKESQQFLLKNQKTKKILVVTNQKISGALSAPIKVFWDITTRCNLRCRHCLSSSGVNIKELSFNQIKTVADELVKAGVFKIKIGGGEPFLHPKIWQIFEYLSQKCGFLVSTSTNGLVIDKKVARKIKKLHLKISVSIDGREPTHDQLRVSGSFKQAIKALKVLKGAGANPAIRTTLFQGKLSNLEDMLYLAELAGEMGLIFKIRRTRPAGRAISNKMIYSKPTKRFWEIIKRLSTMSHVDLEGILSLNLKRRNVYEVGFDCGGGTKSVSINAEGKISPCIFLGKEFISGNIKTDSFMRAWQKGVGFLKIRSIFAKGNPLCQQCSRRFLCRGECRAIAHFATGDWQANDPCCPVINKIL